MSETDKIDRLLEEMQAQRSELQALRREVRRLRRGRLDLVEMDRLADELGVSRRTLYRRLDKANIPVRDMNGFPKEKGDTSKSYVSRTEWEAGERLHTRTVRSEAGAYE
jgi:hypothetical protein